MESVFNLNLIVFIFPLLLKVDIRAILRSIFYFQFSKIYTLIYPLNRKLKKEISYLSNDKVKKFFLIFKYKSEYSKKVDYINKLRLNNIIVALWTNQGTIPALIITISSFIITIIIAFIKAESFLHIILNLAIAYIVLSLVVPFILRQIIEYSSADSYAEISLSDLKQSEILTFISYKYWLLIDQFLNSVNKNISILENISDNLKKNKDINEGSLKTALMRYNSSLITFKSNSYVNLNKCKALKKEATKILNILPIEFSHHITKFSPYIFETKINSMIYEIDSLIYSAGIDENIFDNNFFIKKIENVIDIYNDIEKRQTYLIQLIVFNNIHKYLIGLAAVSSTSRSLKIFTNGLFTLYQNDNKISNIQYSEFKALLYRSKAHYGFDLLIAIENFCKVYSLEFEASINEIDVVIDNKEIISIFSKVKENNYQFEEKDIWILDYIRRQFLKKYSTAHIEIADLFRTQLEFQLQETLKGVFYIVIVGYSRVILKALQSCSELIKKSKIKIFILNEEESSVLDTRMMRYELNLISPNTRFVFTGSDSLLFNLINKQDQLLFIAGAEAYDLKNRILFQTNNFESRLTEFIEKIWLHCCTKPTPKFWILSEQYKVFDSLIEDCIDSDFFADHYEILQAYNFKDIGIEPKLICDIKNF